VKYELKSCITSLKGDSLTLPPLSSLATSPTTFPSDYFSNISYFCLSLSKRYPTPVGRVNVGGLVTCYRIPIEAKFFAPRLTGPGVHPLSCTLGTGSFPGLSGRGLELTNHPYLAPRLKKEKSYNSTPIVCLHGRL